MSEPIRLMWPCDRNLVVITDTFRDHRNRPGYKGSLANDLASLGGEKIPLRSSQNNGIVTLAGWDRSGYGNMVKVTYFSRVVVQTAHMESILVKAGDKLSADTPIGVMGTSGNSTGIHTHFAVWLEGKNIDPLDPANKIELVNTAAELNGQPVTPEPVKPPTKFVLPKLPALPLYKPMAAVTKWINIRDLPGGQDIGDIRPGEVVYVFGYLQMEQDVWFMVMRKPQYSGDVKLPVVGYAAAYYRGETWLEPV